MRTPVWYFINPEGKFDLPEAGSGVQDNYKKRLHIQCIGYCLKCLSRAHYCSVNNTKILSESRSLGRNFPRNAGNLLALQAEKGTSFYARTEEMCTEEVDREIARWIERWVQ